MYQKIITLLAVSTTVLFSASFAGSVSVASPASSANQTSAMSQEQINLTVSGRTLSGSYTDLKGVTTAIQGNNRDIFDFIQAHNTAPITIAGDNASRVKQKLISHNVAEDRITVK